MTSTDNAFAHGVKTVRVTRLTEQDKQKAIDLASGLSTKYWNTYYHVYKEEYGYTVGKYHEDNAIGYCLKGKYTKHFKK